MAVFSTNGTLYVESVFGLEGAGPGTMPFLLTVFTVIFINTLNLLIIAIEKFFQLLIFLSVQYLFDLFDTFLKLFFLVGNDDDVEGFIVLENIFGLLICSSASNCDSASRTLLYQFLRASSGANDLTDVISL